LRRGRVAAEKAMEHQQRVIFGQVVQIDKQRRHLFGVKLLHGPARNSVVAVEVHPENAVRLGFGFSAGFRGAWAAGQDGERMFRAEGADEISLVPSDREIETISDRYKIPLNTHEYAVCLSALGALNLSEAIRAFHDGGDDALAALDEAVAAEMGDRAETAEKFARLARIRGVKDYSLVKALFKDSGLDGRVDDPLLWRAVDKLRRRAEWRGVSVRDLIEEFPWVLSQCWEDRDKGAEVADRLAEYLGRKRDRRMLCRPVVGRAAAAAIAALMKELDRGHAFAWDRDISRAMARARGAAPADVDEAWKLLHTQGGRLFGGVRLLGKYSAEVAADTGEEDRALVATPRRSGREWANAVYLQGIYWAEHWAAEGLARVVFSEAQPLLPTGFPDIAASEAEVAEGTRLDLEQRAFLETVADPMVKVTLLTGEAGTGKTAALRALINGMRAKGLDPPAVIAPTALAARRAAAGTYAAPDTVHRFTGLVVDDGMDGAMDMPDADHVIIREYGLVVVDESSMLTIPMLRRVLSSAVPDTRFVFAGDPAQLPPIGAGGAFEDVIRLADDGWPSIRRVELVTNHRSDEEIIRIARAVRRCEPVDVRDFGGNVHLRIVDCEDDAVQECLRAVENALGGERFDPERIMVLSPVRHKADACGTALLNEAMHGKFGGDCAQINSVFAIGAPVVAVENDYPPKRRRNDDADDSRPRRHPRRDVVLNGMKGLIAGVSDDEPGDKTVLVAFSGQTQPTPYFLGEMEAWLEPAWAMTVHKAQGGQAQNVVIALLSRQHLLDRRLVYTALTRCARGGTVTIVTTEDFARIYVDRPPDGEARPRLAQVRRALYYRAKDLFLERPEAAKARMRTRRFDD